MSIELTCLQCGTSHLVNNRMAGRRVRCPDCDAPVEVPLAAPPAATESNDVNPAASEVDVVALADPVVEYPPEAPINFHKGTDWEEGHAVEHWIADDDDVDDQVLLRRPRPQEEMDMTPMVDVTFLLLIFFMVTAAFSLQKSIEMPRQQTDAPSTTVIEEEIEELDMVEVQVDEFGSFLVMAQEWERETPGKQNLLAALREAIAGNSDGMRLVVKVHEMAKLHALVDAMDAGTIAGYSQLEVTQVEEFD